ncbi:hypothetical protein [Edaphobacter bradus]|uniref:hypothetical protein n=1 Tax=Edaphobacter bradus TaxID=2259016 RepID=UPI0021DFF08A|nr:hypothetical protein [Edaphobacter bradus]
MQSPIYLMSWVSAACAIWLVWSLGIKPLVLDAYRERLFELRFQLFQLGVDGKLSFNSDTYRTLETLLCGLLRFAHRVTLVTYALSRIEQDKAKKEPDHGNLSQQITLKISRTDPEAQEKLYKLMNELRDAIFLYIAFSSILFMLIAAAFGIAQLLGLWHPEKTKKELTGVIETEAYRTEAKRHLTLQHA